MVVFEGGITRVFIGHAPIVCSNGRCLKIFHNWFLAARHACPETESCDCSCCFFRVPTMPLLMPIPIPATE